MKKLTSLRKKVDGNTKVVESLMNTLDETKINAEKLSLQAQEELEQAEAEYDTFRTDYGELQKRCRKVSNFVSKIIGV